MKKMAKVKNEWSKMPSKKEIEELWAKNETKIRISKLLNSYDRNRLSDIIEFEIETSLGCVDEGQEALRIFKEAYAENWSAELSKMGSCPQKNLNRVERCDRPLLLE